MVKFATILGVAVLFLHGGAALGDDGGWSAGAARADITPKGQVWMAGYAARKTPSEGVAHPLFAKALALRDGRGRALLWITADLIGFDRELTERVARRLGEAHALPREAIALIASHTHCGPLVKYVPETLASYGIDPESDVARNNAEYRRELEETLVRLGGEAVAKIRPVKLDYAVGRADFATNRREKTATGFKIGVNPDGPTDRSVPALRATDADGRVIAIAFGYACHNTTLGGGMLEINADYAGFAQDAIEAEHPGAVSLFLTGCGGDANPHPRGTLDLAKAYGRALAGAVGTALRGPTTTISGALASAMAEPTLAFAGPTDRETYEARLKEPGATRQAHAKRMLAAMDAGKPIRAKYSYPIQAFALGDRLTVVALAGEVVSDYAIRIKKELGDEGGSVWVAAYANDVFGYVGSARVIREGGYEGLEAYYYTTFPTPLSEGVEDLIVNTARDLAARVRGR